MINSRDIARQHTYINNTRVSDSAVKTFVSFWSVSVLSCLPTILSFKFLSGYTGEAVALGIGLVWLAYIFKPWMGYCKQLMNQPK